MAAPNNSQIDPAHIGRMGALVERLTDQLKETTEELRRIRTESAIETKQLRMEMKTLENRLVEIENRFRFGKGAFIGILLAAGGAVWGMRDLIVGFFGGGKAP